MYLNKLAMAVKNNGKVLREFGDTVYVPFGSEYSLFFKNLNSVRAMIDVSIDGKEVISNLVVNPNSSVDLERYVQSSNSERGNRFKFIERTESIDTHRGVGAEDGLIHVTFKWELPLYHNNMFHGLSGSIGDPSVLRSRSYTSKEPVATYSTQASCSTSQPGITVPGSISNQRFESVAWFPTETISNSMVIKLVGEVQGVEVKEPVTVKTNHKCVTCGTVNKIDSKFCSECGTSLQIF